MPSIRTPRIVGAHLVDPTIDGGSTVISGGLTVHGNALFDQGNFTVQEPTAKSIQITGAGTTDITISCDAFSLSTVGNASVTSGAQLNLTSAGDLALESTVEGITAVVGPGKVIGLADDVLVTGSTTLEGDVDLGNNAADILSAFGSPGDVRQNVSLGSGTLAADIANALGAYGILDVAP